MKLDIIDRKILCELDGNCRTPLARTAKKLRIGRNVAAYRIKNLEKEGIISRYICSLNLGLLGYKTYKIYFKIRSGKEEKFADFLLKEKKVIQLLKNEGEFEYSASVVVKNVNELDDFLTEIKNRFKELIKDYSVNIVVYSRIFKIDKLLLGGKQKIPKIEKYSAEGKEVNIDETDKKILLAVSQNANLPAVEISKKTGLSIDIAKYRLRNLSKNIISSFRPVIDFNKLDYHNYVMNLSIRKAGREEEEKLVGWCSSKRNVLYCTKAIGSYDFSINAAIKDIDELNSFLSELKGKFDYIIDSYSVIINSRILKLNYVPFSFSLEKKNTHYIKNAKHF